MTRSQALHHRLPKHLAARQAAKHREWSVQILAIVLAIASMVGASALVTPINDIRRERQLVIDPDSIKGLPPDIALLGKLGTFRALAIDWAWIRAERLKEEGKTYEALQLHLTICTLAPRFPKVWSYAAWDMAYNISVTQYMPETRWQWVKNGISILRDKGIPYNPRSVTLYKELAWIYWHKIGDFLDDEHMNYKRALAIEMERVLGPPPIVLNDQEYLDWFRKIVEAPDDPRELLRQDPETEALANRLHGVGLELDESLLDFIARHVRPELAVSDLVKEKLTEDPLTARRLEIVTDADVAAPLDRLLAAVRSKVLREQYKLDPEWMMHLMADQYGPLDWRNAFSHSLYWASLGDKIGKGYENANPSDAMNAARFVFFSLNNLINRGRVSLDPNFDDPFSSYIELTPDTRFIPYLYETYMRLGKEQFGDDPRYIEGTPGPQYMTGFVTNMHNWIELLYLEGGEQNLKLAVNFYAWLRENNPHPNGSTQERYLQTLDEFVMGDILAQLQTFRAVGAILRSFIRRALKQFALAQTDAGITSMIRARQCYDYWMAATTGDLNERRKMQHPQKLFRDEIYAFMKDRQVDALFKARLWRRLPLEQRRMTYDELSPYFEKLCEAQQPPWALERAFTEPVGMEQFRRAGIERRNELQQEDAERGQRYKP